ncbi:actin-interacting protein (Bud6/Aip3) [Aspergillus nomiae NRRL 13137]|uniref:Actin-interacting protein (Bud6/Aip3) n=1 Tax=Aspergillus nomiae NRRL (strain ATCC 15546 / NRRL 13137 / CBS 260.88 / M93) TaxID=1509407 RepID=A0A0L1J8H3_ASPN3|nr:actin-interacting protein (Bud6/Aip3) [Aspergillus nomiae NRRL 13137]KNG88106.1 actin-interacting protein (Bud6/Aip3) [Aspergillus nomiae NRRL 13137]
MQSASSVSSRSQRSPSAQHFSSGSGSSIESAMTSQSSAPRSSSSSGRSQSRSSVPDKQISQIEKSVTHLLVATKQLLETLTQWSRKQASENEVSDVYVRLGYEFNLACRAFNAIGVDTSDLGPVPDLLRTILEDTLSQDASPQSLDRYLPRIRDIIINLLHGLKKKQARLRSRQQREESRSVPGRQASAGSVTSGQAAMNQAYEETVSTVSSPKRTGRRYGSNGSVEDPSGTSRMSPAPTDTRGGSFSEREASRREAQNILSQSSQPESDSTPKAPASSVNPSEYPTPPPPPPKQDDAIGALQRSGELERRASRRFSAYQIQKHLGTSSSGVPVLPTQHSPLPNRGRDVRESLNAVRLRGSYAHGRQRSTNRLQETTTTKTAPAQAPPNVPSIEEERSKSRAEASTSVSATDFPIPQDKVQKRPDTETIDLPRPQEEPSLAEAFQPAKESTSDAVASPTTPKSERRQPPSVSTPPQSTQFTVEQPSPGKELTLFLQYKSKIKKYVLPEGFTGLTIGRLQLAFIEKFAWNTHNNGADLPEIYIQDTVSGVRHELEDLNDVKDRSVLVLNVDILDEVKKHFDDEFGGVRRLIEGVKDALNGQESVMQRVSDRQLEAAKEMARLAAAPPVSVSSASSGGPSKSPIAGSDSQLAELQSLRRDIAVLRQTYSNFQSDIASSMNAIRTKASGVKSAATEVSLPTFEGDAGRARVNSGKKELGEESERLVARVDDLQDLVEDLRKDVVTRGVRPLPRQLESVGKDISAVTKEIKKMQEFLKREKPIWTKIWEKELQLVCEERDQLTMQEDLAADLQDDVEKAAQTFALVEQATKEQAMQNNPTNGVTLRNTSRNVVIDPAVDPMKAKDSVLGEVRALQPNHESRLEAIERAEKARQKELENRRIGLFQKELGAFVEEGKLKKSGGVEETERLRRAKDDRIRKEVWERQQARAAEMEKAEAEAAAAQAEQASQRESNTTDGAEAKAEDGASETGDENETSSLKGKEPISEEAEETESKKEESESAKNDEDKPTQPETS